MSSKARWQRRRGGVSALDPATVGCVGSPWGYRQLVSTRLDELNGARMGALFVLSQLIGPDPVMFMVYAGLRFTMLVSAPLFSKSLFKVGSYNVNFAQHC